MTMAGYWAAVALTVVGFIALAALAVDALGRLRRAARAATDLRVGLVRRTEPLALSLSTLRERVTNSGR